MKVCIIKKEFEFNAYIKYLLFVVIIELRKFNWNYMYKFNN